MPNVILGPFNTIAVAAAQGVYRLTGSQGIARTVDVLNVGPGSIYMRADKDPAISDPHALLLPPNWAKSGIIIDGRAGLGIVADADTMISVSAA
jgi:hypothetical protein